MSGPSSTAFPMICCSKRWLTTPMSGGFCSTSRGGSKPPCRWPTGPCPHERREPRKAPRFRRCSPTCSCTMHSISGWPRSSRAVRSSADDIVAHCDTEDQARALRAAIAERLGLLGLKLHPEKTKVVYCKDAHRRGNSEHTSFDFLGYTFRARIARGRRGFFVNFLPAMSVKAKKAKGSQIRGLAPQTSQRVGPVRTRRGHQPSSAGLDQLLRSLLPLRGE